MLNPLLAAKLYIPPHDARAVARPRLVEKLRAAVEFPGQFVLLSGPAGFGKTTLLSEFSASKPYPTVWLSLDDADNDPNHFWTYLIAACQPAAAGAGESALALLKTPQPLPEQAIPTLLINDLISQRRTFVLVLDDAHAIQNPAIHAELLFLLEHLPPALRPVISTRTDPPWPLARLRARSQMVEIRAQDLRFTMEEASAFISRALGFTLPAESLASLEDRTEGWAAGLQLAALSMQGRSDIEAFIQAFTGSHVYIAEYLIDEVLKRQPEEMQSFLLQTSILDQFDGALCEAVTGCQDGQGKIKSLQQTNSFIHSLDDEGRWFRYHHLFADLLRAHMRKVFTVQAVNESHRRAARWYVQHGFPTQAVNHALAALDFETAAGIIASHANAVLTRGELTTLRRWIEALPEEVQSRHPLVLLSKAWMLTLAGDIEQVIPILRQINTQAEADRGNPVSQELLGNAAAIRAFFAMLSGDYPLALEQAEQAEALVPEHSVHARWLLPHIRGAAFRAQGEYQKAEEAFTQQARMGEVHDNLIVWATGVTEVAIVRRQQGRLRDAAETCRQALRQAAEKGASQFGSLAKIEVPLVDVLREQNVLDEARQRIDDILARMKGWPMPTDLLFANLARIRVQEAQGDLRGAGQTLREMQALIANHIVIANLARSVALAEVRLAIKTGNIPAAARSLETLRTRPIRAVGPRQEEQLLLARLQLAQGNSTAAEQSLLSLMDATETHGHTAALIEVYALLALVRAAQGDLAAAAQTIAPALALAAPEGFTRTFLEEGERMLQILLAQKRRLAAAAGPQSLAQQATIDRLLDAFAVEGFPTAPARPAEPPAGLVEPLSARELEVLRRIAAGESNREIAEQLVITESAVKKHTGNIYGKLNVRSRTQAVARARQLGILSQGE